MTTLIRLAPLVLAVVMMQTPATEPGFTQLFNGKDFTGWKLSNPAAFTIEDGAIVAKAVGMQGHAFYDGPFMEHSFRNFELKVDVMTRNNSTAAYSSSPSSSRKGGPRRGSNPGEQHLHQGSGQDRQPVSRVGIKEQLVKDDEWFTEHIVVQGDMITVKVNDKQTVNWTQPKEWAGSPDFAKRVLSPGTVALQAHDPNSTVYYKNIRIKPLQ